MIRKVVPAVAILLFLLCAASAMAQTSPQQIVLDRGTAPVVLEPYAPNIIRVTLSLLKDAALAPPGYGISAKPSSEGWSYEKTEDGDIYKSSRLVVKLPVNHHKGGAPLNTQIDIAKYFNGSTPGAPVTVTTPDGKTLLDMQGWQMSVPNNKDGNAQIVNDKRPSDPAFYEVGAS